MIAKNVFQNGSSGNNHYTKKAGTQVRNYESPAPQLYSINKPLLHHN